MVRIYAMHQPLRVFFFAGTVLTIVGLVPVARFLWFYFTAGGAGHVQSLVLGGTCLLMGFVAYLVGLFADLISHNRQLLEMTLERVRRLELSSNGRGSGVVTGTTGAECSRGSRDRRFGPLDDGLPHSWRVGQKPGRVMWSPRRRTGAGTPSRSRARSRWSS